MEDFDLLSPTDKPALVAVNTPESLEACRAALTQLGYKVHAVDGHAQFHARFYQIHYQVVIIEETFFSSTAEENLSLQTLKTMLMPQRRHAAILLVGAAFETLNALQAFAQSVHCVVNYTEMPLIGQLIQKAVSDQDLFLAPYHKVQQRMFKDAG